MSVALLTVAPASSIGSICAIGVTLPVLPTFHSTDKSLLVNSCGANLKAIAHLGNFAVKPSSSLCFRSFSFITSPSIKISNFAFTLSTLFAISSISAAVEHTSKSFPVKNLFLFKKSKTSC